MYIPNADSEVAFTPGPMFTPPTEPAYIKPLVLRL
jgi:hypothetical protein